MRANGRILIVLLALLMAAYGCDGDTGSGNNSANNSGTNAGTNSGNNSGTNSGTNSGNNSGNNNVSPSDSWEYVGPVDVGFVASIAFPPGGGNTVWASGDDGDGLYVSKDGGSTWTLVQGLPANMSSYALTVDPQNPDIIYAPNHFGRGMLISRDGGQTWTLSDAGLPTYEDEKSRINDLAIDDEGTVWLATGKGLYASHDSGQSFQRVDFTGTSQDATCTAVAALGSLVAVGLDSGDVWLSTDHGSTWKDLDTQVPVPVSSIALTFDSVYVGFMLGALGRWPVAQGNATILNNPNSSPAFTSLLWTKVKVIPGASPQQDTLLVGVVSGYGGQPQENNFYISTDGGRTWQARANGLNGASIFDFAFDPADAAHIVAGTVGDGIYVTTDGGQNWQKASGTLRATAVLGFAVDPAAPDHWLLSSTEGLDFTPGVYETTDGGTSWTAVSLPRDVIALRFGVTDSRNILAAIMDFQNGGVLRSSSGTAGPWQEVDALKGKVIVKFKDGEVDGRRVIWALGTGLFATEDDGATWETLLNGLVYDVDSLDGLLLACGGAVWLSSDGGKSFRSLEMPFDMPQRDFTACALVRDGTSIDALVAMDGGMLFLIRDVDSEGPTLEWETPGSPASDATIRSIVRSHGAIYLSALKADVDIGPDTTSGAWYSTDGGHTWHEAMGGMYPSTMVWQLEPGPDGSLYAAMWGGGLFRLFEPD